jgi:hypothetical protein
MHSDRNPYAPPRADVADAAPAPRVKPRTVVWAVTALWVSYGLSFAQAAIVHKDRLMSWPPQPIVIAQAISELFYAALIYFVSGDRKWARAIYAVLLLVQTVVVFLNAQALWHYSEGLMLITATSFMCDYVAIYWLFTEPVARWFKN